MTAEEFLDSIQHIVRVPLERRGHVIAVLETIVRDREGTA